MDFTELPPQFSALLDADVHCVLAHTVLDDNRQYVQEPDEDDASLRFRAALDREAGTVHLLAFPPVVDRVGTDFGRVRATVTIEGEPAGRYDHATGHVHIEVTLVFDPDHFLAKRSRVTLTLSSAHQFDEPEVTATGDPLTFDDGTLTLVGSGTFEGGSLHGGAIWLAIGCEVLEIEVEA